MKIIKWLAIIIVIVIMSMIGFIGWQKYNKRSSSIIPKENSSQNEKESIAIKAGKLLSNNNCKGSGSGILSRLPMDETDYAMILPYGLVIGGHVTPIDHQYFSPMVFNSPRDTYPVYAMADAKIVDIQPRVTERGTEYRLVFTMSCTFFYYYDLVTSLTPELKTATDKRKFNIDIKTGQLIGKIGGQTLDFAVWDTTKPLKNFVNPASYIGEAWKIYTADPLDYYTPEIKAKAMAKYIRTTAPLSGRIDYDIDGKLVGNWFKTGTGGYRAESNRNPEYWGGHLSIAPDYIDNSAIIASFGSWDNGEAKQFMVKDPLNPTTIGVEQGLIKYELYYNSRYSKSDGTMWDGMSLVHDPKIKLNQNEFAGCALFQLTSKQALTMEQFPNQKCSSVLGFSGKEATYER